MRMAAAAMTSWAVLGCDKDPVKTDPPATSSTPTNAPPAPAAPTKPQLALDDTAVFVAGERLDLAAPDLKGRIVTALSGKPVEGETLVLNAARETKCPRSRRSSPRSSRRR